MTEIEMCNLLADYMKEDASIPIDKLRSRGLCQLKHAKIILAKFTSHNSDYAVPAGGQPTPKCQRCDGSRSITVGGFDGVFKVPCPECTR